MLLPPSYEEMVPLNHPVRVVNEVVERIDITKPGYNVQASTEKQYIVNYTRLSKVQPTRGHSKDTSKNTSLHTEPHRKP